MEIEQIANVFMSELAFTNTCLVALALVVVVAIAIFAKLYNEQSRELKRLQKKIHDIQIKNIQYR